MTSKDDGIKSIDEIIDGIVMDMKRFMDKYHYPYDKWFVVISEDPKIQLSQVHGVLPGHGACTHRPTPSAEVARIIVGQFIEKIGTDGSLDNGGEDARFIYAYKKTKNTKP